MYFLFCGERHVWPYQSDSPEGSTDPIPSLIGLRRMLSQSTGSKVMTSTIALFIIVVISAIIGE